MILFSENGFRKIGYEQAKQFLLPRHYSGRVPGIIYAYGYFQQGILKAVITYGIPASHYVCLCCGQQYKDKVIELNRLCRQKDCNISMSQFVSWSLRQLKKYGLIVVSYSDMAMNHHGYIYQATNFLYTGKTKKRTDACSNGKHPRHIDNEDVYRVIRSEKHRYIYFAMSERKRKHAMKALTYSVLPYPKGANNQDYEFGFKLQQERL